MKNSNYSYHAYYPCFLRRKRNIMFLRFLLENGDRWKWKIDSIQCRVHKGNLFQWFLRGKGVDWKCYYFIYFALNNKNFIFAVVSCFYLFEKNLIIAINHFSRRQKLTMLHHLLPLLTLPNLIALLYSNQPPPFQKITHWVIPFKHIPVKL